jgi:hypothetical protein
MSHQDSRVTSDPNCTSDGGQSPGVRYRAGLGANRQAVLAAMRKIEGIVGEAARIMPEGWGGGALGHLSELRERLAEPFRVGVIGEFRAGKSSVVNALLGAEVAPVSEFECTFATQSFAYGDVPEATLEMSDGSTERTTPQEAWSRLAALAEEGEDGGITHAHVALPAPILDGIEIWDSPGLSGSDRNDELAREFVGRLDAAIWVFNQQYIGQAALVSVLGGLRQRGKLVVGVVNKCEAIGTADFARLTDAIGRAYSGAEFAAIVPFSARLALRPDPMRPTDPDLAVADDGNMSILLAQIRSAIVADVDRLSATAAAGDVRAIAHALRDDLDHEVLQAKRLQHLYTSQRDQMTGMLKDRMASLGGELEHGLIASVRAQLAVDAQTAVGQAPVALLKDDRGFARIAAQVVTDQRVEALLDEYFASQVPTIKETLRALAIDGDQALTAKLTPLECSNAIPAPGDVDVSVATSPSFSMAPVAAAATTGAALSLMALTMPGPHWPFVIAGTVAAYIGGYMYTTMKGTESDSDIRARRLDQIGQAIAEVFTGPRLSALMSTLRTALISIVDKFTIWYDDYLTQSVLSGVSPSQIEARVAALTAARYQMETVLTSIAATGANLPAAPTGLTKGLIRAGQRTPAFELLQTVLSQSSEMVSILDGAFSVGDLRMLLEVADRATIRIVAWQQPLSGAGQAFRAALAELQTKRSGAVSAIAPLLVEQSGPALPACAWVFVPGRAYSFSASLGEVLAASADIDFQAYEDDGTRYDRDFMRWWKGEVKGYTAIKV